MGFNNDGAEAVAAPAGRPREPRAAIRAGPRREHRQDQGRPRGRRGRGPPTTSSRPACSRPTPTTWSSTSARPTRPGLRNLQAVDQLEPLLEPRVPRTRGRATSPCWSRSRPTSPTRTCSPWPTWPSAIGLDGIIATNTTISPRRPASTPQQVDASARAGCPAARCAERSRRCCACCASGSATRPDPDRRSAASPRSRTRAPGSTPAPTCCRATPASSTRGPSGPAGSLDGAPA